MKKEDSTGMEKYDKFRSDSLKRATGISNLHIIDSYLKQDLSLFNP